MKSKFRCIGCGQDYPIDQVVFSCSQCSDLLAVEHETKLLSQKSGIEWKQLFDSRHCYSQAPYNSGVWAKREWIAPHILDNDIVTMGEGNSPLVTSKQLATWAGCKELRIKQCGISHTGSFKDLGMTVLVSHVQFLKRIGRNVSAVICASTGDTSAALSAYAASADIPSIVLLPQGKISPAQLVQPISNHATVIGLETDFDGCMAMVKELVQEHGLYLANSMNAMRLEGQKTVAIETLQQLAYNPPDWIVIPGGNLGNTSALAAGLRMLRELGLIETQPRICVAQAANASPLYNSYKDDFNSTSPVTAKPTLASAIQIGNPVSIAKAISAIQDFDGVVETATEQELANASAYADLVGQYACPHTGVALAAVKKLRQNGKIAESDKVVVVSTAAGLKFSEIKSNYHSGSLEKINAKYRNKIHKTKNEASAVIDVIRSSLSL